MHVHFTYEAIEIYLSELTIVARKVFWFFTIVTIETVHLIFWWLSNRTRTRFRDFKSKTRNWSIIILSLIRINDDNHFIISCCIAEKFFTSWFIVHISQNLINVATHLDKFMKISRFVRLDSESLLQLVRHLILEIFE